MEFLTWLTSAIAPWIGVLSLSVFALIPAVYFLSVARPSLKKVSVACPESGETLRVAMEIDIFRNPLKIGKGIDVVRCPHFFGEEVVCSKGCVLTAKVQQIHRRAGERHLEKTAVVAS